MFHDDDLEEEQFFTWTICSCFWLNPVALIQAVLISWHLPSINNGLTSGWRNSLCFVFHWGNRGRREQMGRRVESACYLLSAECSTGYLIPNLTFHTCIYHNSSLNSQIFHFKFDFWIVQSTNSRSRKMSMNRIWLFIWQGLPRTSSGQGTFTSPSGI